MASTGHSLMPAGLEQGLDPEGLRDLVALIQRQSADGDAMNGSGRSPARAGGRAGAGLALALLAVAWWMKRRLIAPESIDAAPLRPPVRAPPRARRSRSSSAGSRFG